MKTLKHRPGLPSRHIMIIINEVGILFDNNTFAGLAAPARVYAFYTECHSSHIMLTIRTDIVRRVSTDENLRRNADTGAGRCRHADTIGPLRLQRRYLHARHLRVVYLYASDDAVSRRMSCPLRFHRTVYHCKITTGVELKKPCPRSRQTIICCC